MADFSGFDWEKYLEEDRDTQGLPGTQLEAPRNQLAEAFGFAGGGGAKEGKLDLFESMMRDGPEVSNRALLPATGGASQLPPSGTDPTREIGLPFKPVPIGADGGAGGAGGADEDGQGIPDVEELRGEPWTSEFEQAALARADELAGERFNATRQTRQMELARRGIGPDSPLYQRFMGRIDADQAKELAGFRRNLQIEKVDRRQKNLAMARLIEQQADTMERQRMMDLLQLMGGAPNLFGQMTNINQLIASLMGQQASSASAEAGSAFGGVGDLLAALLGSGAFG